MPSCIHPSRTKWFDQVWNRGNLEAVHRLLMPETAIHHVAQDGNTSTGPEAFPGFFSSFRAAFPDIHVRVHDVACQNGIEAGRWTVTGTHTGHTLGFPATNKRVSFAGMTLMREKDGKVAEAWNVWAAHDLYRQLGFTMVPPNPETAQIVSA